MCGSECLREICARSLECSSTFKSSDSCLWHQLLLFSPSMILPVVVLGGECRAHSLQYTLFICKHVDLGPRLSNPASEVKIACIRETI